MRILNLTFSAVCSAVLLLLAGCPGKPATKTPENTRLVELHAAVLQVRSAGLLAGWTDARLDSLEKVSLGADSLNALQDLLVRADEMLDIRLGGDTDMTAVQLYTPEFEKITKRWPDLKADSISGQFLPSDPESNDTGIALVRFRADNRTYERRHYWMSDDVTDYLYYRTFNKLLADRGEKTRLFMVQYLCRNCKNIFDDREIQPDIKHIGLLRLTEEQGKAIQLVKELLMDEVNEFTVYTSEKTEQVLAQFAQSGLLTPADSAWWREAKAAVRQTTIYSTENILDEFSKFFAIADFQSLNDLDPYGEMLGRIAEASGGMLDAGTIADERVSSATHVVRFSIGNKLYEKAYAQNDSIWSPEIITDFNNALDEQKKGAALYTVFAKGKTLQFAMIRNNAVEQAKASGFFPMLVRGVPAEIVQEYNAAKEK
ncbi:MAG: hypothetical protein ACRC3B_01185 [Bacteroidia bacterium]